MDRNTIPGIPAWEGGIRPHTQPPPFKLAAAGSSGRGGGGGGGGELHKKETAPSSASDSDDRELLAKLNLRTPQLQFGGPGWPLPVQPALIDVGLTVNVEDLISEDVLQAVSCAEQPPAESGGPEQEQHPPVGSLDANFTGVHSTTRAADDTSVQGSSALASVLHTFLEGGAAAAIPKAIEATTCSWLSLVFEPSPAGLQFIGGPSLRLDHLARAIPHCPGLGDCVLDHALPTLLVGVAAMSHDNGSGTLDARLQRLLRVAFCHSAWAASGCLGVHGRLLALGLGVSGVPGGAAVEAALMNCASEYAVART